MKVCFLEGDMTRSGGTERVTACIAGALAPFYEVHVLSVCKSGKTNFFPLDRRITDRTLFSQPAVDFKRQALCVVKKIRRYCKENQIDILIDVDVILNIFSVPALLGLPVRLISWEHFNFQETLGVPMRAWGRKLSARSCDAIVTLTQKDKEFYLQGLRLKCPVVNIYNPMLYGQEPEGAAYRLDSKIILSAGRLTRQKGFDYLVKAAVQVFARHPDWEWWICGEGEERPALEQQIRQAGLEGKVRLLGNIHGIEDYYRRAGIFVLTSRSEGFGLVLTEAKRFRLPVVSFRCPCGPSEIVLDGKNGFLVDCFQTDTLADRVCQLIEQPHLRRMFSDNALLDAEKFGLPQITQQWRALLEALPEKRRRGR